MKCINKTTTITKAMKEVPREMMRAGVVVAVPLSGSSFMFCGLSPFSNPF